MKKKELENKIQEIEIILNDIMIKIQNWIYDL